MRRRCLIRPALALALMLASMSSEGDDDQGDRPRIGQRVDGLAFKDIRFLTRSLDDFGSMAAFVIVATNSTCPVAQRYLPVLGELEKVYRDRKVQFLALNVDPDDSITEMAAHAVETKVEFPFVKDLGSTCIQKLGLKRTPEIVVLDARYCIRYRGPDRRPVPPYRRTPQGGPARPAGRPGRRARGSGGRPTRDLGGWLSDLSPRSL